MLFFYLENQLFFIVSMVFSTYFFLNSLLVKLQSVKLRAFGLNYVISLTLNISAFFTAPFDKAEAMQLLLLGHILLIFFCTITLSVKETEGLKLFYLLPFVVVGISFIYAGSFMYRMYFSTFSIIIISLMLINIFLSFYSFFTKKRAYCSAYFGLFMVSAALAVWLLSNIITMESVVFLSVGFLLCAIFVYRNSLGYFYKEYYKNSEDLRRINSSVQKEVIKRVSEVERSNRLLLEKSKKDGLTGLYSNSAIVNSLNTIIKRSPHYVLSIIMLDIDNFKQINDNFGHQKGDRCIKIVSNFAQSSFRQDDIIGRYGGDEFMIILPTTTLSKAYSIAERFRKLIQTNTSPKFTISVGISCYPDDGQTASELIEAADKALYVSKERGKNQITLYSSIESQP